LAGAVQAAEDDSSVEFHRRKTDCMARYYQALIEGAKTLGDEEARIYADRKTENCKSRYSVKPTTPVGFSPDSYDEAEVEKYMDQDELDLIRMCASPPADASSSAMRTLTAICVAQGRVGDKKK